MGKKTNSTKKRGRKGSTNSSLLSAPVTSSSEFEGLAGYEEISSCTFMKVNKHGKVKWEVWKDNKITKLKKNKKKKINPERELTDDTDKKGKKKKKKKKKKRKMATTDPGTDDVNGDQCSSDQKAENTPETTVGEELPQQTSEGKLKKRKKKKQSVESDAAAAKKVCYDNTAYHGQGRVGKNKVDVSAWEEVFVPPPVLKALSELGFSHPTEIQKLVLPAAIKGRMDIIGAAETGSGKTLAFGIPIIDGILKDKLREAEDTEVEDGEDSGVENNDHIVDDDIDETNSNDEVHEDDEDGDDGDTDDEAHTDEEEEEAVFDDGLDEAEDDSSDGDTQISEDSLENVDMLEEEDQNLGCVRVIDNVEFDFMEEGNKKKVGEKSKIPHKKLRALIITPTRELAVQVKSHLSAILVHTDIRASVIMGGVASQKQERLLRHGPEIVVGTPGRLWELIQQGNEHLSQVPDVQYLAIDETDRMVERGHFQELTELLEMLNSNKESKAKRQTFVFSATLTMVHQVPKRLAMKRKTVKVTSEIKIDQLAKMIGVKPNPKIVDVTHKFGTAESLTEARINCDKEEKDFYLYYFLKRYPGRTLVFCNSIDCVRRLQNLFTLLQCQPQSLHASMHQKQRLKSLERFSSNPQALLLATDVAARGLDIPNIEHVIHYQVPRTAETYIHRSGRTARARQEGLSILLIEMSEMKKYRQLCVTLNRATNLPPFPVDVNVMNQVKRRIKLARRVETLEHRLRKIHAEKDWFRRAAQEAELLLDEDDFDEEAETGAAMKAAQEKRDLQNKRAELTRMLQTPFVSSTFSGKYPTQSGALILPQTANSDAANRTSSESKALSIMKKESEQYSKLEKTVKVPAPVIKVNKKKFKGFQKRKLKRQQEMKAMKAS